MRAFLVLAAIAAASARIYETNTDYAAFPTLSCDDITFTMSCSCDTTIKGATMRVAEGHKAGVSKLTCTACAGITTNFDSNTGVLSLTGAKTMREYTAAIASVQFRTSQDNGDYRVEYNFGHGIFSKATGHFYNFHHYQMPCPNNQCHWTDAQSDCAAKENDLLGLIGYLVTVTSEAEKGFAAATLHAEGWIGLTDFQEGKWRWVTGPEGVQGGCAPYDTSRTDARRSACDVFPLSRSMNPCGGSECDKGLLIGTGNARTGWYQPAAGQYNNWQGGEPNGWDNYCWGGDCATTGEDYGHFYENGNWNDFPYTHDNIEGYVCEWGGVGELCIKDEDLHDSTAFVKSCDRYKTVDECEEDKAACYWSGGSCFKFVECKCDHSCTNC